MTLLDYKNILFKFFLENDKCILPDDARKLQLVSDFPEFDLEVFKIALESYVETNLVKKFEFKDGKTLKTGYVLTQNLQNYEQNVILGGELCYYISQTLNQVKDEGSPDVCNSLGITNKDIEDLIILIGGLMKEREGYKKIQE